MNDYGLPLQFGLSVTPETSAIHDITALVKVADTAGLELVAIQDHPYQSRFLDTWTLMTFLAAQTTQIRFFPDVANLPLRPPAVLAKAAASLDQLTGGRVELGIGAGGFWDAIVAMGGPRRTPAEAVEATEEAIQITRLVWGAERSVSFNGKHYHLRGYHPGPRPAHAMGIWVGAVKPRMLRLIGRLADGWVVSVMYVPPAEALIGQGTIDEAARTAGRDPSAIRRIYNVSGVIGGVGSGAGINGSVEQWVDTLAEWATEIGFDTFIFWPSVPSTEQVKLFASEVAPRVRERVAVLRGK
jgi:alkanesulfonate monooxygenase SsuD/methylene tetrahydromethanopterin reductase-like flavin-dependent oxidoreductase (luciferase family)